jgi:membrane protease YdiL (CAAX protease family)
MMKKKRRSSAGIKNTELRPTRSLVLPLFFGMLVFAVGALARRLMDGDAIVSLVDGGTPGMLIWILSPALLAWVFRRCDADVQSTRPFAFGWPTLRFSLGVAVVAMFVVWCVIKLGLAMGGLVIDHSVAPLPFQVRLRELVGIACFALLEESAWRGYLMPALLARFRYLVVLMIGAVIWFAWHLPYLDVLSASYTSESTNTLAPRLFVGVVAMQFVYIELFLVCRSVWPAFALHAALNLVAQGSIATGLTLNRTHTWAFSPSADGLPIMLLCAGVGFVLYRVRMNHDQKMRG